MEVWKVVSSWLATSSPIKGSYAMEVQRIVPSWLASLGTIKIPTPWMGGVFPTPRKCGNRSYAMEAWRVELSWLATSSTIKVPTPWKHRVGCI